MDVFWGALRSRVGGYLLQLAVRDRYLIVNRGAYQDFLQLHSHLICGQGVFRYLW